MNELEKLINQKVIAEIEIDEGELEYVEGIVLSINVDDYYFYEKQESIYITVSIKPITELSEDFDYELLTEIPLSNIKKA